MLDGLRSRALRPDVAFDKIVASLLPLLEKSLPARSQPFAPNYSDLSDPRPIFDWMQVTRWSTWAGCAVRRRGRGGGGQLDVQRPAPGGRPHLQFGIDDWPPGAAVSAIPINVHADGRIQ